MWLVFALVAALCQVLRNTVMKRLGHSLDEYINVWGRFTFLLPFAGLFVLWKGVPVIKPAGMAETDSGCLSRCTVSGMLRAARSCGCWLRSSRSASAAL